MPQTFHENIVRAELDYSQWMFLFGLFKAAGQEYDPVVQMLVVQVQEAVGRNQPSIPKRQ